MRKPSNPKDPVVEGMEKLEAAIRLAEEKVRHDYPEARGLADDIRDLRYHARATLADVYRCRLDEAFIAMMHWGERTRVLWDEAKQVITRPEEYGLTPVEWANQLVDLAVRLAAEECQCQVHPGSMS